MASVETYIQKLQSINVDTLTDAIIKDKQTELVDVNIENLADGKNYEGKVVGVYSQLTEDIAKLENPLLPKKAGERYNFVWSGDLISNIFVSLRGNKLIYDSTGKGTGDKLGFVNKNKLLGVENNKSEHVNKKIMLPEYRKRIKNALG